MNLILGVIAGGLLFPVLIFIGTATRLSAARREQRFAAMRLVGATPRQISVVAAVEAAAAAVAGTAVGFGLFYAFRGPLAGIPFTGMPFFPSDMSLGRKPRQVFTREVLLEQVWGYRHAADTRLVNVHVQRLRAKIEPDPERPEIILTVRGVGYKAGTA